MTQQLHDKFVILAGMPKCGSTSLFEYMIAHPKIAGAYKKEPNYFLPPELAFSRLAIGTKSNDAEVNLNDYLEAFPSVDGQAVYRLDGSIEYCNSWKSAEAIHTHLSNVKLIFILRNPVDRFISLYRFYKQTHHIPVNMTLEQFADGIDGAERLTKRSYNVGQYTDRLRPYWERFSHNKILLLSFSELKQNPLQLMQKVCGFLDLDASIYDDYHFKKYNVTRTARNTTIDRIQHKLIVKLRKPFLRYPKLFYYLRTIHLQTWVAVYEKINGKPVVHEPVDEAILARLRTYYADEAQKLYELTGVDGLLT